MAAQPARVSYSSVAAVKVPCEVLLSALAHAGARTPAAVSTAFEQARTALELPTATLRAAGDVQPDMLDAALAALGESAPGVKRKVLQAAVAAISADRDVTATEAELLRAISASLGVPMPPLLG